MSDEKRIRALDYDVYLRRLKHKVGLASAALMLAHNDYRTVQRECERKKTAYEEAEKVRLMAIAALEALRSVECDILEI